MRSRRLQSLSVAVDGSISSNISFFGYSNHPYPHSPYLTSLCTMLFLRCVPPEPERNKMKKENVQDKFLAGSGACLRFTATCSFIVMALLVLSSADDQELRSTARLHENSGRHIQRLRGHPAQGVDTQSRIPLSGRSICSSSTTIGRRCTDALEAQCH